MKFSKKMILVDYDETTGSASFARVNNPTIFGITSKKPLASDVVKDFAEPESDERKLGDLDSEILAVLNNKKLRNYDKIKIYNELLRRYMLKKDDVSRKRKLDSDAIIERLSEAVAAKADVQKRMAPNMTPGVSNLTTSTPEAKFQADNKPLKRKGVLTNMFEKYAPIDKDDVDISPVMLGIKNKKRSLDKASYIKSRKVLYTHSPDSGSDVNSSDDDEIGGSPVKQNKSRHSVLGENLADITPPFPQQGSPFTVSSVIKAWTPILRKDKILRT
jgi:hypothetical protein